MMRYFMLLPLDSMVSWWRIGEVIVAQSQLVSLSCALPLTQHSSIFECLLARLPKVENIRTVVVVEIDAEIAQEVPVCGMMVLDIDALMNVWPLDSSSSNLMHMQMMLPAIPLRKDAFLTMMLIAVCIQKLQEKPTQINQPAQVSLASLWNVIKGYIMPKTINKYYLPMSIEGVMSWHRIGEVNINQELIVQIPRSHCLPISKRADLEKVKAVLPRFENIRNLVMIEINAAVCERGQWFLKAGRDQKTTNNHVCKMIDYDAIHIVYPLDTDEKSHLYLQSLVPSIPINKQSFLDKKLSTSLIHWSKQRDAQLAIEKMVNLLGVPYPAFYVKSDVGKNVLEVLVMEESPEHNDSKIQSFLYHLFFYSRNTMKSEFRREDLGFVDDMAKILIDAIPRETIIGMGLNYKDALQFLRSEHRHSSLGLLIRELNIHNLQIAGGLQHHYQTDVFIPALIFLKLKNMQSDRLEPDAFYRCISELHEFACDESLLATGIAWFAAFYGFVELQPLYNALKPKAPFFVKLEKEYKCIQDISEKTNPEINKTSMANEPINDVAIIEPATKQNDLDKSIFIKEGANTWYAIINQQGSYLVNEGKRKKYISVTCVELIDKKSTWLEGQIKMRKESSSSEVGKLLSEIEGA